jgi:integrase/recombinase XerD
MRLAEDFLRRYRGHTLTAYRRDLTAWWVWCDDLDVDPLDVSARHSDAYAAVLAQQGRSGATIARTLSALAGFYNYATSENSPTLGFGKDEAVALLRAAEAAGPHRFALVTLLLLVGLRASEACALNIEDVGEQRGHRTITVTRKGGARHTLPLAPPPLTPSTKPLETARTDRCCATTTAPHGRRQRVQSGAAAPTPRRHR